jgi:hypothetical protein
MTNEVLNISIHRLLIIPMHVLFDGLRCSLNQYQRRILKEQNVWDQLLLPHLLVPSERQTNLVSFKKDGNQQSRPAEDPRYHCKAAMQETRMTDGTRRLGFQLGARLRTP